MGAKLPMILTVTALAPVACFSTAICLEVSLYSPWLADKSDLQRSRKADVRPHLDFCRKGCRDCQVSLNRHRLSLLSWANPQCLHQLWLLLSLLRGNFIFIYLFDNPAISGLCSSFSFNHARLCYRYDNPIPALTHFNTRAVWPAEALWTPSHITTQLLLGMAFLAEVGGLMIQGGWES